MPVELQRYKGNPILAPNKQNPWESRVVMNPCVIYENNNFHMLYRALSLDGITRPNGRQYHYSCIGYAKSNDGIDFKRRRQPFIKPEYDWEGLGCEDARIVKIDDVYFIFYSAISQTETGELKVQIAGATTKDFEQIEKLGVINLEGRGKAASFFPEKINDKYTFLYTQFADGPESTIFYAQVDSAEQLFDEGEWKKINKMPLLSPSKNAYRGPELGAPPIKTPDGWLLIYCPESFKKEWFIGAALLDLNNPTKVIAKTTKPLLKPDASYEIEGYVDNVAFPEGAIVVGDELYVYYGGADAKCCLATCKFRDLLSSLT